MPVLAPSEPTDGTPWFVANADALADTSGSTSNETSQEPKREQAEHRGWRDTGRCAGRDWHADVSVHGHRVFDRAVGRRTARDERSAAIHDELLRAAIANQLGSVFSTAGDGLGAVFGSAPEAVGAALDAQRAFEAVTWPTTVPLRVRMGVHTGAAEVRDGDYFGPAVNRAARVMGLARGGQILVSLGCRKALYDAPF